MNQERNQRVYYNNIQDYKVFHQCKEYIIIRIECKEYTPSLPTHDTIRYNLLLVENDHFKMTFILIKRKI